MRALANIHPLIFLIIATALEAGGDAVVRIALYQHSGPVRLALLVGGGALLLGYGTFLNLAPFEFGRLIGLYIATFFIMWQVVNLIAFKTLPTAPILLGGLLIIAGGALVTLWKPR